MFLILWAAISFLVLAFVIGFIISLGLGRVTGDKVKASDDETDYQFARQRQNVLLTLPANFRKARQPLQLEAKPPQVPAAPEIPASKKYYMKLGNKKVEIQETEVKSVKAQGFEILIE